MWRGKEREMIRKFKENESFKDFLMKEVKEDFDVYWYIETWIDRKWDEYNGT
jgi:hypothetical protein